MVAVERRLVHEYLRDRDDVETYSEGDEPDATSSSRRCRAAERFTFFRHGETIRVACLS